jgi:4-hydroxy-tetrahydrodipicolinate reductase
MTRKVAIVGMGKMGHAVSELAPSRGWEVVARMDSAAVVRGITREALNGADVAVEFTVPAAAPGNVRALAATGCPAVVGTTGWYDDLPSICDEVMARGSALLTAANFSLGVNIFEQIVEVAARLLGRAPSFSAQIIETHRAAKRDAPSGSAATLGKTASAAWARRGADRGFRSRVSGLGQFPARTNSSSTRRSSRYISSTLRGIDACSPKARSLPLPG